MRVSLGSHPTCSECGTKVRWAKHGKRAEVFNMKTQPHRTGGPVLFSINESNQATAIVAQDAGHPRHEDVCGQ
jgi:hypothetical protein